MSKIWFTSDTHFGSERTLELSKRPFNTVELMDLTMMFNWNSLVDEDDIIYHLGDFGNFDMVKRLNGNIRLLCGNYEEEYSIEELELFGFEMVTKSKSDCLFLNDDMAPTLCYCHEPENRNKNKNRFNLFGHIHKLQMVKHNGLNVGVDCHDFCPIDLDTVMFYKNAIENFYDDNVFMI